VVQMVILLDFTQTWNDAWVAMEDDSYLYGLLAITVGAYLGCAGLLGVLFYWFKPAGAGDCSFNVTVIVLSVVLVVAFSLLSMHPIVRRPPLLGCPVKTRRALPAASTLQLPLLLCALRRLPPSWRPPIGCTWTYVACRIGHWVPIRGGCRSRRSGAGCAVLRCRASSHIQLLFSCFTCFPQARNGSLFPSAIIGLYCMYLCYSALQSEPHDYECNGARWLHALACALRPL
jgi:Serine incorporator (Serinc)